MRVREVCTENPVRCGLDDPLSKAATAMWDYDCGIMPVVDAGGNLRGVISDRDITMAAMTKNRAPSEISVREVMSGAVRICHPEDDVLDALKTLAAHRIRRLPVVDGDGRLIGMLSLSDVIHRTQIPGRGPEEIPAKDVLAVLKEVLTPWREIHKQGAAQSFSRLGRS